MPPGPAAAAAAALGYHDRDHPPRSHGLSLIITRDPAITVAHRDQGPVTVGGSSGQARRRRRGSESVTVSPVTVTVTVDLGGSAARAPSHASARAARSPSRTDVVAAYTRQASAPRLRLRRSKVPRP